MSEVTGDTIPPEENIPKSSGFVVEQNILPWVDYAVQQAQTAQKTIETTVENAIEVTRSRVDRILTTSSAHLNQTLDSLQDVKADYSAYEEFAVGKIKEGFLIASSNQLITAGTVLGVGVLGLKRTRQFLYYKSMRLLFSEETMLSRADAKVKELRKSVDLLKAESDKLEKRALQAEEDLVRGRTKLRQAGKQIQSVISSAYKIERQAAGLKDVLRELPSREASRFRTQVTLHIPCEGKSLRLQMLLKRRSTKGMLCPRKLRRSVIMGSLSESLLFWPSFQQHIACINF